MKKKLPFDKYGFVIVADIDELRLAVSAGHHNVKAICPRCGKELLTTPIGAGQHFEKHCKDTSNAK